jgi:hypothetical protein
MTEPKILSQATVTVRGMCPYHFNKIRDMKEEMKMYSINVTVDFYLDPYTLICEPDKLTINSVSGDTKRKAWIPSYNKSNIILYIRTYFDDQLKHACVSEFIKKNPEFWKDYP